MWKMGIIKDITSTTTFKQSVITSTSTLINGGLGALFYFLLARFLGTHEYGVFTLATTIIALVAGVFDMGTDQGIIRFVPRNKANPQEQKKIIKLALKIKLILGGLAAIALWVLATPIATTVLSEPSFAKIVPLIGVGVLSQLLFSFATSLSQALERFFLWSSLFITTNLARLISVIVLFGLLGLNGRTTVIVYIVFPLLGFLFSLFFLDTSFLRVKNELGKLREFFGFNKWVVAFVVVATISSRLEIFFTNKYLGLSALGVYGLILQISNIMPQLTTAIGAVTSPKFASFTNSNQNRQYTLKAMLLTTFVGFLAFAVLVPVGWIILNFSGVDYLAGFVPMIVLLFAMVIFIASAPLRDSIIYYFAKPAFFFWNGLAHAAVVSLSSIFLIPAYSLFGTALVVLFGQVLIAVVSIVYFLYISQKA